MDMRKRKMWVGIRKDVGELENLAEDVKNMGNAGGPGRRAPKELDLDLPRARGRYQQQL